MDTAAKETREAQAGGGRTVSILARRKFPIDYRDQPVSSRTSSLIAFLIANAYRAIANEFAGHGTTTHGAGQYVDLNDRTIHSNTVEGYFSIFKRGMKGVYQHCGDQHLHRYLAELEFRYNTRVANGTDDRARGDLALVGIIGKRLEYRSANAA